MPLVRSDTRLREHGLAFIQRQSLAWGRAELEGREGEEKRRLLAHGAEDGLSGVDHDLGDGLVSLSGGGGEAGLGLGEDETRRREGDWRKKERRREKEGRRRRRKGMRRRRAKIKDLREGSAGSLAVKVVNSDAFNGVDGAGRVLVDKGETTWKGMRRGEVG